MNSTCKTTATAALGTALVMLLTQCRSLPSGATKADEPVGTLDRTQRHIWSVRMGLFLGDEEGGARILDVTDASFAASVGLQVGDVITELNGRRLNSQAEFEDIAVFYASGQESNWDGVWQFTVSRKDFKKVVRPPDGYACDPYMLVGCGPLNGGT